MGNRLSCAVAAGPEEVKDGRGEPDDGRQERESDDSFELAAWVVAVQADVAPVERGATSTSIEIVNEEAKCRPPAEADDNVEDPAEVPAGKEDPYHGYEQ